MRITQILNLIFSLLSDWRGAANAYYAGKKVKKKVKTPIIEYVVFEPNVLINDFDGLTVAVTHASPLRFDVMWVAYGSAGR
ncbi:hypothetical protein ACFL1J_01730 [Pseudomonadota bacterium]